MNKVHWYKLFLSIFIALPLVAIVPIFIFQTRVDPFDTWGAEKREGYNYFKSAQRNTERLFKPFQYRNAKPDVVFFGSSRINFIMPATWPGKDDEAVFNYGINAAHIPEEAAFFHNALSTHVPEITVVAIDMLQFSAYLNKFQTGFSQERLDMVALSPYTAFVQNAVETVFSFDAVALSEETIVENEKREQPRHYYLRGWNTLGDKRGYHIKEYKRVLWKFLHGTYRNYQFSVDNYRQFQQMIDRAVSTETRLILYISPINCDFLSTIYVSDQWDAFEDFKRKMVATGQPIWDFNYINTVTTKRTNFIDPSHFLPRIGKRIQGILDTEQPEGDFGVILTKDNIESELKKQRQSLTNWMNTHPEMLKMLKDGQKIKGREQFGPRANLIIRRDL